MKGRQRVPYSENVMALASLPVSDPCPLGWQEECAPGPAEAVQGSRKLSPQLGVQLVSSRGPGGLIQILGFSWDVVSWRKGGLGLVEAARAARPGCKRGWCKGRFRVGGIRHLEAPGT